MKIVLHYRAGTFLRRRLESLGAEGINVVIVDETDRAGFLREIIDADVLLHVLEPATAAMIAGAPRLKLIQKIGVGLNTIDREAAAAAGVRVANMPGTNSQAVAEHTLALMLAVLRRIVPLNRATREGRGWDLPPDELEQAGELGGRVVGLVGFGEVPRRLAPVLRALGADVLYHSRSPQAGVEGYRSLTDLLAQTDVLSLHVPITAETRYLIDAAAIRRLKPCAVIINTARGGLINEAALAAALAGGHLRGAGLDVLESEPAGPGNLLFDLPNVVVTPHIAWLTPETIERSLAVAIENCRRIQRDQPLLNEAIWSSSK